MNLSSASVRFLPLLVVLASCVALAPVFNSVLVFVPLDSLSVVAPLVDDDDDDEDNTGGLFSKNENEIGVFVVVVKGGLVDLKGSGFELNREGVGAAFSIETDDDVDAGGAALNPPNPLNPENILGLLVSSLEVMIDAAPEKIDLKNRKT